MSDILRLILLARKRNKRHIVTLNQIPEHIVGADLGSTDQRIRQYLGKKKNGKLSLLGVVLYRERMPCWQYILWGVAIVAWIVSLNKLGAVVVCCVNHCGNCFSKAFTLAVAPHC